MPAPTSDHANAIIAAAAALGGAVIGGAASIVATILTIKGAQARELRLQSQRDARVDAGVRRSVLAIVRAIPEAFRPVYVRGSIAFEAWEFYNNALRDRINRDDAAIAFEDNVHALLWNLQVESAFTQHFVLDHVRQGKPDPLPPQTPHDIIIVWLAGLVAVLSKALASLGDDDLAKEVTRRQEQGQLRIEAVEMRQMQRFADASQDDDEQEDSGAAD